MSSVSPSKAVTGQRQAGRDCHSSVRRNYLFFCDSVVTRARQRGKLDDDVLAEAALDVFMNLERKNDEAEKKAALRKANRLMRRPDIKDRISQIFRIRGFSIVDATDQLIEHIQGASVPARDSQGNIMLHRDTGEPIMVRQEPNLQALLAYFKMVLPVESRMKVTVGVERPDNGEAPPLTPMLPRVLSSEIERTADGS